MNTPPLLNNHFLLKVNSAFPEAIVKIVRKVASPFKLSDGDGFC